MKKIIIWILILANLNGYAQLCIPHNCTNTIYLPRDTMDLFARPSKPVKARAWTQTSGPAKVSLLFTANPDSVLAIGFKTPGQYIFTYTGTTIAETKSVRDTVNVFPDDCIVCPLPPAVIVPCPPIIPCPSCPVIPKQRTAIGYSFDITGKLIFMYDDNSK